MTRASLGLLLLVRASLGAVSAPVDDPRLTFEPDSAWSAGLLPGRGGRRTTTRGASVTFTGNIQGMRLFGAVGPDGAQFSAVIDGGSPQLFSAQMAAPQPNAGLIDFARLDISAQTAGCDFTDSLVARNHTIVFAHADSRPDRVFEWDHVRITINDGSVAAFAAPLAAASASVLGGPNGTRASDNFGNNASDAKGESPGVIAGSTIGGLVLVGALLAILFRFRNRLLTLFRRQRRIVDDDHSFYAPEKQRKQSWVQIEDETVPPVPPLPAFTSRPPATFTPLSRSPSSATSPIRVPPPSLTASPTAPTPAYLNGRISAISESSGAGSQVDPRRGTLTPTRRVW